MQSRNYILLGVALALGLVAVVVANAYFGGVEERQERVAQEQQLSRIVVASQDMAFGTPLGEQNLRLANWPASSVPVGAFTKIEDAFRGGRVALRPMVVGEPVLASKISGVDGRATLSANLPKGKLAFSIPITEVSGVGGFVRPGDRVDVLLTRPIPGESTNSSTDKMTDVIVEAAPVLGIDQVADEKNTQAVVAKTATLEVTTIEAQKLALGIQLGTLSLALRNVADGQTGAQATVLPRNLSGSGVYLRPSGATVPRRTASATPASRRRASSAPAVSAPSRPTSPTMTVVRGSEASEYEVKRGV
jgi:pilus assembly protein CpaB